MSNAQEEAFYYALQHVQQGATPEQVGQQLAASGWSEGDIQSILHRVEVQCHGSPADTTPRATWNDPREKRSLPTESGHVSKAFRHLVKKASGGTLDLDEVNFMGPIMLIFGGLILLFGLLGVMLLVSFNRGDIVKMMVFPVLIGVTFVKAGIDTYRKPKD